MKLTVLLSMQHLPMLYNVLFFTSCSMLPADHRYRLCRSRSRCRAVLGGATPPESQGDPNVQEGLVQMVRLQIGKEKVKESVEEERQKLQKLAEEVRSVQHLGSLELLSSFSHRSAWPFITSM
jgi:hypothetical protein